MSHIVAVELVVEDLDVLAAACRKIGLTLHRGVKNYKWYGRSVGDYPLPSGVAVEDLGKCDHVIRVDGAAGQTYEIGVVKKKDEKGFSLLWDFWNGGYGLQDVVGENCKNLKRSYAMEKTRDWGRKNGYRVVETTAGGKPAIRLLK